jgi:CDP-paratose 2-epimerase
MRVRGPASLPTLGGGRDNSISILEAFKLIERYPATRCSRVCRREPGDHICYISDLSKMRAHYPKWDITKDLKTTFNEIFEAWLKRDDKAGV